MKIAFIGIGHMGLPMVVNLLKANDAVHVFDLDPGALKQAKKAGARVAPSIAEAVIDAQAVVTMLQTGEQVESVCLGEQGIFANMHKDALYIDSSSIDIVTCRNIHAQAKNNNITMVDAPVSGGVAGAQAATLTIMVGGEANAFEKARHLLEKLGKNIIHAGHPGCGQVAKICNNMILGVSMIAVSEAFALGESLGLEPNVFYDIAAKSSGQCWSMTSYCPVPGILEGVPSNNQYKPGFSSAMMLKDLRLAQDAASINHSATPMGKEAAAVYAQFVASGHSDVDFSGIYKVLHK